MRGVCGAFLQDERGNAFNTAGRCADEILPHDHEWRLEVVCDGTQKPSKTSIWCSANKTKGVAGYPTKWRNNKMAKYRKLSRTSSQRKALLRGQVTALLNNGKIITTEAKAKEVRKIAEGLIALAVKEKDNFEEVTVKAKVARKDKDGKRVKEVVDGKRVTLYDEVEKTIKKDKPSRLHARREMLKVLYTVKEVPAEAAGRKRNTKEVDLVAKLFDEIAPKYVGRNGGYTRIVKIGQRKGDGALEVLLELV